METATRDYIPKSELDKPKRVTFNEYCSYLSRVSVSIGCDIMLFV